MEDFWKAAVGIAGLGAIGAYVFYALYRGWLKLDVFSKLSGRDTYRIFRLFLTFTLIFALAALAAFFFRPQDPGSSALDGLKDYTTARHATLLAILDNQIAFFESVNDTAGKRLAEKLKADAARLNAARLQAIQSNNLIGMMERVNELAELVNQYQLSAGRKYDDSQVAPAQSWTESKNELDRFLRELKFMNHYVHTPSQPPRTIDDYLRMGPARVDG